MENYFNTHPVVFAAFEAFIVTLTLPLFVAVLVHVLRGNREGFVILMASLVLLMYAVYYDYIYNYAINGRSSISESNIPYELSVMMFLSIHWGIAYTYFECSSTLTSKGNPPPSRNKIIGLRIWLVTVLILILCSGTYPIITSGKSLKKLIFGLSVLICLVINVTMIVSLYKIKHIIGSYSRGKANIRRMVSHASAFLVAVAALIISKYAREYYPYVSWLINNILLTISQRFLFLLLWHLGSKETYILRPSSGVSSERESIFAYDASRNSSARISL